MSLDDNMVPKVHPLERAIEADDPYELVASSVPGDPEVMLECLLQEFLWQGWSDEQLLGLFENPGYPLLVEMQAHFGADEIRRRLTDLTSVGVQLRVTEHIAEPDEEDEHDLVQLSLNPISASIHG